MLIQCAVILRDKASRCTEYVYIQLSACYHYNGVDISICMVCFSMIISHHINIIQEELDKAICTYVNQVQIFYKNGEDVRMAQARSTCRTRKLHSEALAAYAWTIIQPRCCNISLHLTAFCMVCFTLEKVRCQLLFFPCT